MWEQTTCPAPFPAFPSFLFPPGPCPIPCPQQDTRGAGPQSKLMLPGMGWRSCSPKPLCSLCFPGTRLVECSRGTPPSQPACSTPVWGDKHLPIINWWPFMGDNPIPEASRPAGWLIFDVFHGYISIEMGLDPKLSLECCSRLWECHGHHPCRASAVESHEGELGTHTEGNKGREISLWELLISAGGRALREEGNLDFHRSHQACGVGLIQSSDCATSEAQQGHTSPTPRARGCRSISKCKDHTLAHPCQSQQRWMDPPQHPAGNPCPAPPEQLRNYPGDLQGEVKETPHPAAGSGKGISPLLL